MICAEMPLGVSTRSRSVPKDRRRPCRVTSERPVASERGSVRDAWLGELAIGSDRSGC